MGTVALVVAAGRGERFGGDAPKQYQLLAGRPLIRHCLETFLGHAAVDSVRVVIQPEHRGMYDAAAAGLDLPEPVSGGTTRQESVRNGLESLSGLAPHSVLIHDAARPFVDGATIDRVLEALTRTSGAIAAVPVIDTIKRADANGCIAATIDRAGLWRAQTPQGFRYRDILMAHRGAAGTNQTDDAAVAEAAGLPVALVIGSQSNLKVTTAADRARAEEILLARAGARLESRSGTGFDVHRFAAGSDIKLCGVLIPHDHSLEGHSDADVGLHALTDAILGAIGAGDIGYHFPPSDPQWRGVASARFLAHAARLVAERGGQIVHVDVTLICERPKIAPHRAAMVASIASILEIEADRVSVKATTTEGLGFTGRSEGIAAQAVATVTLPVPPRRDASAMRR